MPNPLKSPAIPPVGPDPKKIEALASAFLKAYVQFGQQHYAIGRNPPVQLLLTTLAKIAADAIRAAPSKDERIQLASDFGEVFDMFVGVSPVEIAKYRNDHRKIALPVEGSA